MFSRRNLAILVVVLALGAGAYYLWQQQAAQQAAAAALRQETIGRGSIVAVVSATGPLAAESQVNLFFGVAAPVPVAEVTVALGDPVKKDQVLARLDAQDLELALRQAEQSLQSAQLALEKLRRPARPEEIAVAQANLRVAKAQVYQASQASTQEQVEVARLNLVIAQRTLDQINQRVDDLIEQGRFAEKQNLEAQQEQARENARIADLRYQQAQAPASPGRAGSALASVEQAQVTLDKLTRGPDPDELQIAQLQVNQAQAALDQARHNLREAQIVAPFDGVVAAVNVRAGETAAGGLPAIVVVDTRQYHVDVAVDEVDIARIAPGQSVTVTVDALPNEVFSAVVESIAPQSTVNAGVVSYPVRVVLQAAAAQLRAGLTSTAEIVVQSARDVVLAPNWAIRRDRATGQAFASVWRNGQVQEVEVTLGLRNDSVSQVISGLNAGDVVAINTARQQFSFFGGGG